MPGPPELIEAWRIARAIGWPTKKTKQFLVSTGLAFKLDGWHEFLVSRAHFEASMPQIYRIVAAKFETGELDSSRGKKCNRGR